MTGGVAQVVKCLPSKHKVLTLTPPQNKTKQNKSITKKGLVERKEKHEFKTTHGLTEWLK
jgi:hypothetical protein